MRNFILAGNVAYGTALPLAVGAVAFTYLNNGKETIDATGAKITDKFYLEVGDSTSVMKNFPMYKKHFSYVKGVYSAATTFSANLTLTDVSSYSDYTVMIVKKGLKFNERNKWSAVIHTGLNPAVADVASKLAKQINNNSKTHGITATAAAGKITFTAEKAGVDYNIIGADNLTGIDVTIAAKGIPAYGDTAYITDLAEKAAADAGYEYTYRDVDVNVGYPFNPSKAVAPAAETGYTIFTMRFAVPREMKTRDEVVHQIVQVAFPTGCDAIATFETVLKAIVTEEKA